jgi:transposase InsO family protein
MPCNPEEDHPMAETLDPKMAVALFRYEVIAAYLAAQPPRGQRGPLLAQLAARTWTDPRGQPHTFSAETLRTWVRRYRRTGLQGLLDSPRPQRGVQTLTPLQVELVCGLKREVPERSLERVLHIAGSLGLIAPGTLTRSTLHRVLQTRGLSRRPDRVPDAQDLDRFEAAFPNALWQSDMLEGPWLPDPERPGKVRRAHLYAFLDDHSRLLLYGRFSFKGDLPALELVFRQALRRWGKPRRVYYDNGAVYRSDHMQRIVAELGLQRIIHTRAYRPMGHGKIEAFNRFVRAAFLAELRASPLPTLDALNEAFTAWADHEYNRRTHSEIGQCPLDRWNVGVARIEYAEEEALRRAFLWSEPRTPDKTGLFSLFGTRYQVGPSLARKRVDVRFDPEHLVEVEIWHQDRFVERVRPFQVQPHRRPRPDDDAEPSPGKPGTSVTPGKVPTADWLGHLVRTRQRDGFVAPAPRALVEEHAAQRARADQALVDLLADRLDPAVVDPVAVRTFLERFGPFDPEAAAAVLDGLLAREPNDRHVTVYLDAIRRQTIGDPS